MGERLLSFTEYLENILCVYRNYYMFDTDKQYLIVIRILIELSLITAHAIFYTLYYPFNMKGAIYFYLSCGNSVLVIVLALYHGRTYKSFKRHLNYGFKYFMNDDNYRRNVEAKHSGFIALVCVITVMQIGMFMYNILYNIVPDIPWVWKILFVTNRVICELRYIYEYLVLYCFLYLTYEQINMITRFLDGDIFSLNNDMIIRVCNERNENLITDVQKSCIGYKHIRQNCKFFNTMFGFQLTFILTAAIFFYIIFLYTSTSQGVSGDMSTIDVVIHTGAVLLMLYILFMLSHSAQLMQNSTDHLRRRLCRVLIVALSDQRNHQVTKDLLRMMSTCPIRVRAFGGIPVDMTLLPTCISIFLTYTVIALQFNNVL